MTVTALGEELPLILSVSRAAEVVGLSRAAMYEAVKRGDFETVQVNGRTVVLTLPLLRRLGVDV